MGTATLTAPEQLTDTFPINGTDFVEFYVGNAKQAAHFYRNTFGYKILA
jgi:4-hydroxyphenylpyruvate dioxygenase